jgi:hypothetical protein
VAVSANRTEGVITIEGGGEVDVWTLDHERAGRGRRYHLALIDEGAWGGVELLETWQASIMPTLLDFQGRAVVASTPNGVDENNFFWHLCHQPELGLRAISRPDP